MDFHPPPRDLVTKAGKGKCSLHQLRLAVALAGASEGAGGLGDGS